MTRHSELLKQWERICRWLRPKPPTIHVTFEFVDRCTPQLRTAQERLAELAMQPASDAMRNRR